MEQIRFLTPHIINPKLAHTHTIILLHGRNSTGPDFAEELFEGTTSTGQAFATGAPALQEGCKWIFPTAPSTYSEQFQEDMTEWFDIASTSFPQSAPERQTRGLRESTAHVAAIIEQELQLLPASRIVLGGVSQGFATAVHVLLSGQHQLGGFLGLSGWLAPLSMQVLPSASAAAIATPMLITHSQDDEVIEIGQGRNASSTLRAAGATVVFKEYVDGGHELNEPHGFDNMEEFLSMFMKS